MQVELKLIVIVLEMSHQAVIAFRNDNVWAKTKAAVAKVGRATLPLMIEIGGGYLKEQLGLKD